MNLLISFPDQSASYTNGVELGRILRMMETADATVSNQGFPIHTSNIEVIKSACQRYGYVPSFAESGVEGWTEFFAIKSHSLTN